MSEPQLKDKLIQTKGKMKITFFHVIVHFLNLFVPKLLHCAPNRPLKKQIAQPMAS